MIVKLYFELFWSQIIVLEFSYTYLQTILYCPFAKSNDCIIVSINNNQIKRFVVDQFVGITFYVNSHFDSENRRSLLK